MSTMSDTTGAVVQVDGVVIERVTDSQGRDGFDVYLCDTAGERAQQELIALEELLGWSLKDSQVERIFSPRPSPIFSYSNSVTYTRHLIKES